MLFTTLTVEEARNKVKECIKPLPVERVTLGAASGRVVAEEIHAPEDVPGFDRATMDGFAVRAQDTFGATEGLPAYLRVTGEVLMGRAPEGAVHPGEAWRIPTGGMLPEAADAVVMVEYTEEAGPSNQGSECWVAVLRPVAPGENLVRRGEDARSGEKLIAAGMRLRAQDIGLLAACGVGMVPVRRRPVAAIIGTGDEVVGTEVALKPGQVRDVNTVALAAAVEAAGGRPEVYGVVPDELPALQAALQRAVAGSDMVLLSGGSSVGTRDLTLSAISSLAQAEVLFHGLAVRPGKPTVGAVVGGKMVFGLPGHPVSALVVFEVLVKPFIEQEGCRRLPLKAVLKRSLHSAPGREDYVRVRLTLENGGLAAEPVLGKSGLIATLSRADALVRLPLDAEGAQAGEMVDVFLT
ncbi:MAG: gephyrin-like molybdotransferase Glp [Bacillota bacterium]